ncbi:hypothetical protein COV24_00265, partial [candidate division WWE3 bacterium CG10_big_fil_rev_8_21_14_0_10_32_10]
MCGISGVNFCSKDKATIDLGTSLFKSLLNENTKRGKHSTGILYIAEKVTQIVKSPISGTYAANMVWMPDNPISCLGHNRHATIGSHTNTNNMHPFETKKYIGMHNGTLHNHEILKQYFNILQKGATDSECIYLLLDKFGLEGLKLLEGAFALAFVEKSDVEKLYIVTNGARPLDFIVVDKKLFCFGSVLEETWELIKKAWEGTSIKYEVLTAEPGVIYAVKHGEIVETLDIGLKILNKKQSDLLLKLSKRSNVYHKITPVARQLTCPKEEKRKISIGFANHGRCTKIKYSSISSTFDSNNLSTSVKRWGTEYCDILLSFIKNYNSGNKYLNHLHVNVSRLGSFINFSDMRGNALADNYLNSPEKTRFNYLVGKCLFGTSGIETQLLLNLMIFATKVTFYATHTHLKHGVMADKILACCLCPKDQKSNFSEIHDKVKAAYIHTNILTQEIKTIENTKDIAYALETPIHQLLPFYYEKIKSIPCSYSYDISELISSNKINMPIDTYKFITRLLAISECCTRAVELITVGKKRNSIIEQKTKYLYNVLENVSNSFVDEEKENLRLPQIEKTVLQMMSGSLSKISYNMQNEFYL